MLDVDQVNEARAHSETESTKRDGKGICTRQVEMSQLFGELGRYGE